MNQFFPQAAPVILASQSPRRRQLLQQAGISFEVLVEPTAEDYPAGMAAEDVPVHIARNKALAVVKKHGLQAQTILAADTIVVLEGGIIGKPANRLHAIEIITSLSGRTHQVITGVVLLRQERETAFAVTTAVTFHTLTHAQIEYYVDAYEPYDKAGAYAIQEWIGVVGIKSIEGDYYNVMGLPVSRVLRELY